MSEEYSSARTSIAKSAGDFISEIITGLAWPVFSVICVILAAIACVGLAKTIPMGESKAGRFQMAVVGESVFRMDTKTGEVWQIRSSGLQQWQISPAEFADSSLFDSAKNWIGRNQANKAP